MVLKSIKKFHSSVNLQLIAFFQASVLIWACGYFTEQWVTVSLRQVFSSVPILKRVTSFRLFHPEWSLTFFYRTAFWSWKSLTLVDSNQSWDWALTLMMVNGINCQCVSQARKLFYNLTDRSRRKRLITLFYRLEIPETSSDQRFLLGKKGKWNRIYRALLGVYWIW